MTTRPDPLRVPAHLAEHEDDSHGKQRGYIRGSDFALPYTSPWSRLHDAEVRAGLLRHVNCAYLSTHGVPPTLLALKQHAQSLCVLIHMLNPTLGAGEINTAAADADADDDDPLALRYRLNDAFDFLADLSTPYANDDPDHNRPLRALANEVRGRDEARGTTAYHCPLATMGAPRAAGAKLRPYASHHNLVLHANACLERLDHEFSATGGLLSVLPTLSAAAADDDAARQTDEHGQPPPARLRLDEDDDDDDDRGGRPVLAHPDLTHARNSLLGQWLHFTQALVARTHDLERAYGAALDVLAGEAAVPHEYLSALSALSSSSSSSSAPGAPAGRALVYPQDRWVLAHAGDAVFELVHQLLDRREAEARARERVFERNGAVGDGQGLARRGGVVHVDVTTRYYRVAGPAGSGRNRSTVFVLPAWGQHPGVAHTRASEGRPTVVGCAQPKWPARATELEKRYEARFREAQRAEADAARLHNEATQLRHDVDLLAAENAALASARDALMLAVGDDEGVRAAARVHQVRERAGRAEREAADARRERDAAAEREERLRRELDMLRRELAALKASQS